MFQMKQFVNTVKAHVTGSTCMSPKTWLDWTMFCITMTLLFTMCCSHVPITADVDNIELMVSDLAGDVSFVCNFANEDSSVAATE